MQFRAEYYNICGGLDFVGVEVAFTVTEQTSNEIEQLILGCFGTSAIPKPN